MQASVPAQTVEVHDPDGIAPQTCRLIRVGEHSVGVFNVDGELVAFRNHCPHRGGPVCEGKLSGTFVPSDEPGRYMLGHEGRVLHCPWHHWEWDITTGRSMFDVSRARLIRHRVDRIDGRAFVAIEPERPDAR